MEHEFIGDFLINVLMKKNIIRNVPLYLGVIILIYIYKMSVCVFVPPGAEGP